MRKPEQELAEIKSMMERSTRFISLSGLSGILAGTYAFVAAVLAYFWIYYPGPPVGIPATIAVGDSVFTKLVLTALVVLVLSFNTAWMLSRKKSRRSAIKFWSPASKRFVQALLIPLGVGGLFCIALLYKGNYALIAPSTLIFYGLALLNASHFTLSDVKYLAYGLLALGVVAAFIPAYGLVIWALGFGVLHIIYGSLMHFKYDG